MVKVLCCWRAKNGPLKTKHTPLPWAKVLVVGSVTFIDAFGGYLIFAFLPFMLHSFFPNLKAEQVGYKGGILAGSYYIGSLMGNPIWGWLSDLLGRRPVLLLGVCGTVLSELLFGFSLNFIWAVAARFLWGVLNGYLFGAAKAYMTEITDDSNQAMAFAIIYAGTGGGKLLGPVAGGFLARPASKYKVLQVPFFCRFPYALPCLVGAAVSILSFIASYFILAEPKKWGGERGTPDNGDSDNSDDDHNHDHDYPQSRTNSWMKMGVIKSENSGEFEVVPTQDISSTESDDSAEGGVTTTVSIETNPLLQEERQKGPVDLHNSRPASSGYGCMSCKGKCTLQNAKLYMVRKFKTGLTKLKRAATVLRDRRVFLSIALYMMLSFSVIVAQELFSLLMVTDHAHGGYSMDGNELGTIFMVVAVCEFTWQLSMFPLIVKCIGYRWTLRLGLVLFAVSCVLLPFSNQITGPIPNTSVLNASLVYSGSGSGFQNSTAIDYCGNDFSEEMHVNKNSVKRIPIYVWVVVVIFLLIMVISRMVSFATLAVLTGNSTVQSTRGTIYGLSEGLTGVSSSLGPIVITPLFAWSENNGLGWPLNYHFVFYLLAASGLLGAALALFLPKSIEKKRDTELENSD